MLEAQTLIDALERTGDYKVLSRITLPKPQLVKTTVKTLAGLYLDVETTGLNNTTDEIIQIAAIPFSFTEDGIINAIHPLINEFQQPQTPISEEITRLTGITNEDVAGKSINTTLLNALAKGTDLVIAHNAGFDRPFVEKLAPEFQNIPWACSQLDVPWKDEGYDKTNLESLVLSLGCFYDKHRADADVIAGLAILNQNLPLSNRNALSVLLQNSRTPTCKVVAAGAPFEAKDELKARRYRWNPDNTPDSPRGWWTTLPETELHTELTWLAKNIFKRPINLPITHITAQDRYSSRAH